mgnify:CR=1 FL=1
MSPTQPTHRPLVAIDWGTSRLRGARLGAQGQALEHREFARGLLTVAPGRFADVLAECFGDWLQAPDGLGLLSGMVGSRQGWQEAAYCPCPAGLDELARQLLWLQPGRLAIVPGLSVQRDEGLPWPLHDVMRGEEVQIMGALALSGRTSARLVLPGTHSKWAQVDNGRITSFQTFMTGEVFAALRNHTILARTLPAPQDNVELDVPAFTQAVRHSLQSGHVLHQLFGTRTLALMARASPAELLSHLSGLLIGEELRAQQFEAEEEILIVGSSALQERYQHALAVCQVRSQCWGAQATWHGLQTIADSLT